MRRYGSVPSCSDPRAGFTLLEALVGLAIAAAILSSIAALAGGALRNWSHGHGAIAGMEMLTRGIARLATDLSLALPIRPPGSEEPTVLFKGDENNLVFVAATGLGAGNGGVELLAFTIAPDPEGMALIRRRGPVASLGAAMADPVAVMRGRMKLAFAYRDAAGARLDSWSGKATLPTAVELEIRGASGASLFPVPVLMPLRTDLSVECLMGGKGAAGTPAEADAEDDDDGSNFRQGQPAAGTAASGAAAPDRACAEPGAPAAPQANANAQAGGSQR